MQDICDRATIHGVIENPRRLLQIELLQGELREKVEHFEPYGFTSTPLLDGEVESIGLFFNSDRSHGAVIVASDRRYRPTDLKPGEVCIFDNLGRRVFLSKDKILIDGVSSNIEIKTAANINIKATGTIYAEASSIQAKAQTVIVDAPNSKFTGNVAIQGTLTANNGTLSLSGSTMTMTGSINTSEDVTAAGISLTSHTHSGVEPGSSNTGAPQ